MRLRIDGGLLAVARMGGGLHRRVDMGRRVGSVPRTIAGAIIALLLVLTVPAGAGARGPSAEVVVRGVTATAAASAVEAAGGSVTAPLPLIDSVGASVPARSLEALGRAPGILAVTPNEPIAFQGSSSNPQTINSVFTREVNADRLHDQGIDGSGVRVALIDTGVTPVPDLRDRLVSVRDPRDPSRTAPCVNFSGEAGCNDSYGHGTFIAGLIAGTGASSDGNYTGVAPGAEIVSIKIAGRDGSADVTKVLAAIQWVVSFADELNIRVLNLSLGTNSKISYRYDPLNFAVERAWFDGIAVVVSAGNLGPEPGTISKPADDPFVITVGAVDDRETPAIDDDRLPFFSSRGPAPENIAKPDVVAPGGRVVSLRSPGSAIEQIAPGGGVDDVYRRGSGTSMSAGITSGAAALALQANPGWTPDRLKFAFTATARKVAERDPTGVGAGLIDAYAAARAAPAGLANQGIPAISNGRGTLDGSRGDVKVESRCTSEVMLIQPRHCDVVEGAETAQGKVFDGEEYVESEWDGSSWYGSQWNSLVPGSSWYESSWYQNTWEGSSWYGSSWYGSTDSTWYGSSWYGSSWYGAWS